MSSPRCCLAGAALGVLLLMACSANGQTAEPDDAAARSEPSPDLDEENRTDGLSRTGKGIRYGSPSGPAEISVWLRAQFRYSEPFDDDPRRTEDFVSPPGGDLEVRRARLKSEGTVLSPKLGFYLEQELAGDPRLLDLRFDLTLREHLRVRIGQYKVFYNRERVDSSGKQQFAERSIVTRPFTLDRQRGVTVAGRVGSGRAFDSWYYLGLMAGDGRDPDATGGTGSGDMWIGRYQWNVIGEPLAFSQSDFAFRKTPAATLSFAAASFEGPYTRFSSSGGGQLDGFEPATDDRYRVRQWLQEFAWQYAGWSVQQEWHVKRVGDRAAGGATRLDGYYAQAGKAWPVTFGDFTRPVEIALRLARVDQNTAVAGDTQRETTLAFNLFLAGHDNKLTFDVSEIRLGDAAGSADTRWRLQWDVSF